MVVLGHEVSAAGTSADSVHAGLACALGCGCVYALDKLIAGVLDSHSEISLWGLRTGGDQPFLEGLLLSSWWRSGPSLDIALQEWALPYLFITHMSSWRDSVAELALSTITHLPSTSEQPQPASTLDVCSLHEHVQGGKTDSPKLKVHIRPLSSWDTQPYSLQGSFLSEATHLLSRHTAR